MQNICDHCEKREGSTFLRTVRNNKKENTVIPCKPLCSTTVNTFLVFYSPYDSLLIIPYCKMNAQSFLGEICCRVLGELCSIVPLVLLQQETWKKQALVGSSVWNYFSWTDYGLESCTCLQLSVSSCYSGCSGDAPGAILIFTHCLKSLAGLNRAAYPKDLQGKLAQCL